MTSDLERLRALVHALECRQWSRAATLAAQLSALCDREGVLAAYLEARPLLDAVGQLVRLLAHAATAAHRADVAEAALVQLLEGLGQDDAPRARAIAAARSAATLLEVARNKAPETLEARGLEAVGRGIALARALDADALEPEPDAAEGPDDAAIAKLVLVAGLRGARVDLARVVLAELRAELEQIGAGLRGARVDLARVVLAELRAELEQIGEATGYPTERACATIDRTLADTADTDEG